MQEWLANIDRTTAAIKADFGYLSADQLNWKPNAETWSIGQNIDHLMVINQSYFPIFEALKAGQYHAPWHAKAGFLVSFMGKLILDSVQTDRQKKGKTFSIWEPTTSDVSANIIEQFEQHQQVLKQYIQTLTSNAEKGAVVASPANRKIVYRLSTAFDIIISHEERHAEQAREVKALQ